VADMRSVVLACIEGVTYSEPVVDYAAWVSRTVAAPMKIMHVDSVDVGHPAYTVGSERPVEEQPVAVCEEYLAQQRSLMLRQAKARAVRNEAFSVEVLQETQNFQDTLTALASEIRVLVTHAHIESGEQLRHRGRLDVIFQAVDRPILFVKRPMSAAPKNMLLPYDGSAQSRKAVEFIKRGTLYKGMHCHVVHLLNSRDADPELVDLAGWELPPAGVSVTSTVIRDYNRNSLIDYQLANDIDLVVLGAFGKAQLGQVFDERYHQSLLYESEAATLLLK
jgi:hypothetical protein